MSLVEMRHHINRPQPCSCGGRGCDDCCPPPCPPPNIDGLLSAWNELARFKCLIGEMVDDAIRRSGGPLKTGPIWGVTDGSAAKPGQVGEIYINQQQFSFGAATQTQIVTAGILSPGDWDCNVTVWADVFTTGIGFYLSPPPAGVTTGMGGTMVEMQGGGGLDATNAVILGEPSAALLAVPSLFPFTVVTNAYGAGNAGNFNISFQARRVR